ncbi:MAG TPA: hypothetical protein VGO16_00935 [Pseudonocardiaceae bacterium]|nr:hypothetical protein [Pseudonocardiaceae bacterium]
MLDRVWERLGISTAIRRVAALRKIDGELAERVIFDLVAQRGGSADGHCPVRQLRYSLKCLSHLTAVSTTIAAAGEHGPYLLALAKGATPDRRHTHYHTPEVTPLGTGCGRPTATISVTSTRTWAHRAPQPPAHHRT